MSVKTVVRDAIRARPGLHDAASNVYSTLHRGRRKVSGTRNRIHVAQGSWLNRLQISVEGNDNVIVVSRDCRVIDSTIRILGNNNSLVIDEGVFLERGELVLEDDGNTLRIGHGATLCRGFHLACTEGTALSIGADALFSSDVQVRTGDSHAIFEGPVRINAAEDTTVGSHVWVGNGARILKGAFVPDESVVATGAIVTKRFDAVGSVLAGSPAACVRTGVRWEGERRSPPAEPPA